MKIAILDITGRNPSQYNPALCSNLQYQLGDNGHVTLLSTSLKSSNVNYSWKKLPTLIPQKYIKSTSLLKRILRLVEVLINYIYVIGFCAFSRPNILHIQWLTLIDFCSLERQILHLIKILSSKTNIILTVHNIFPHDLSIEKKIQYIERFNCIGSYIDSYIVHLESAKKELCSEYAIDESKIFVAYHGIYIPEGYVASSKKEDNKFHIIMYGTQEWYKGTDLLITALKQLPPDYLAKTSTKILGRTTQDLYDRYIGSCEELNIQWENKFVSDGYLYQSIDNSDLIVLPYRKISQSGVLLLALSYRKPILSSDLPSFKETLEGFSDDMFFKSGEAHSLANLLIKYIDNKVDRNREVAIINGLIDKYSWTNTAKATFETYKKTKQHE